MGIDRLNQAAGWLGRWALLLMIAIGAWNVVGRYLGLALGLSLSSNALIEAQWFLFDLAFLLGLGYALKRRAHVRIDIIASKQSPRRQLQLELLGTLGLLLPFALMVLLVSLQPTLQSWLLWKPPPIQGACRAIWPRASSPWVSCCWPCRGWPKRCVYAGPCGNNSRSGRVEPWDLNCKRSAGPSASIPARCSRR